MARLFISYSRSDQTQARFLAGDLEDLNHSVWLDAELAGGQLWWDQILKEIRGCDIFVLVMSKASVVDSLACKREYQYADDLQKSILPVLVAEDVPVSLLPAGLQQVQFVNYQHRDINSIKALARALQALPLGQELPEPLPAAPEPPISYLASLSHQIDLASFLDLDTQSRIVIELKSSLRDPATALDAQLLLKRLRGRHDLFAKIADDIDQVLLPSRTPRRLIATPQAARVKAVPTPMGAMTEQQSIAWLREIVHLWLWSTPFTAFVSSHKFPQRWLHILAYSYLFFGTLLVYYLAGAFAVINLLYALPIATFIIERAFHGRSLEVLVITNKLMHSNKFIHLLLILSISAITGLIVYLSYGFFALPYIYSMTTLSIFPPLLYLHYILGSLIACRNIRASQRGQD